ncbi:hypothetical protein [Helicobacter trogontum]|uniref:Periplasmic protein n=1 Tax=Helicobacter trogontum TaxID=50960 RepID=A0A099VNS3_9HELI|nr:hypothetical protein [Helicobacter trogontum]MCI5786456.1 hypothetical protein [Helicobacter trogontum]TLD83715.1 hypothetical protein LS81_004005 [Helicobacter trogontum]TLD99337.1 hypothetical protein LS80_001450 [Helicobacter trogontum]
MIRGIIAGLVLVVVLGGGYVLYAFYQKMQNTDVQIEEPTTKIPQKQVITNIPKMETIQDDVWISNADEKALATTYQFPSNVLDINIEVKRYEDLKTDYTKVLVKNLDDYKFFCLNEILRQKHIDFSYFKHKDTLDLLLFMPDETQREMILSDFKYYGIEYEISLKK